MENRKPSRVYTVVKRMIKAFYKMEITGLDNLPEGETVIVGNHAQIHGPLACELYFPSNRYTWCAGQMMHLKEVPGYAYQDFWSQKPRYTRWFYHLLAYAITPLALFIFNNANTIPVYRDARVLGTFRSTLEKLRGGAQIVIFPEYDRKYNNILYDFQDRFVDVARLYYTQTEKELCFVPLYTAPKLHRMVLGQPVRFNGSAPIEEERARICQELMTAITDLARGLPRHTVIPYRNIRKRDYPQNLPEEGLQA